MTPDVVTAVQEFSAGKVEYRNDDGGNVACIIGKLALRRRPRRELEFFLKMMEKARPAVLKGVFPVAWSSVPP